MRVQLPQEAPRGLRVLWAVEFAGYGCWWGFWPVSGVLEPVSAVFGVVVAPVMGAGGFGGWFWTRLVRRVRSRQG